MGWPGIHRRIEACIVLLGGRGNSVCFNQKDDSEEHEGWVNSVSMATVRQSCTPKRLDKLGATIGLFIASLVMLALAAYPIYVIRPFREQDPAALQRALWVLLHNKPILFGTLCLIATPAILVWRRSGWVAKLVLAPTVGISLLAAISAWINPYEHMFHPFGAPQYTTIEHASLDPNDMVIAVALGGESRAYGIREMGYHHIVNDRLHQLPIVVTY
jgi:Protein of unknown function (DUF3179)